MKPRENIQTIYQTALAVFSEYGFRKTTMEDVAGRLGMTKGNLYLYVKNKKDLYRKTAAHALLCWQSRVLEAVDAETDVKEKFRLMCIKAVEYLSQDNLLRNLLVRDPEIFPMFSDKDPFADINRNSIALIRSIVVQGIGDGVFRPVDPDRISEVIFMIYKMFIIRMYIRAEDNALHDMFEDTVDLCTRGLFAQ